MLKTSLIKQNHKAVQEIVSRFTQTGQNIEKSKNEKIISMAKDFLGQEKEIIEHILLKTDMSFRPSLLIPDIDALDMIQNYMTDTMGVLKNKIEINHLVDASFILETIAENKF